MSCSSESRNAHKLGCSGVSQAVTPSDQPSPAVQEEIQAAAVISCPPAEGGAAAAASAVTEEGVGIAESGLAAESVSTEESGLTADSCVPPAATRVACVKCMRTFVSARNLRDHINIVHADYTGQLGRSVFLYKFHRVVRLIRFPSYSVCTEVRGTNSVLLNFRFLNPFFDANLKIFLL
jgi:hypothetical protein